MRIWPLFRLIGPGRARRRRNSTPQDIPTDPGTARTDAPAASVSDTTLAPGPEQDGPPPGRTKNLSPDSPDLRDRVYLPTLRGLPPSLNSGCADNPDWQGIVQDQKDTAFCAGYALAGLIEILQRKAWRAAGAGGPAPQRFSPFMLSTWPAATTRCPASTSTPGRRPAPP